MSHKMKWAYCALVLKQVQRTNNGEKYELYVAHADDAAEQFRRTLATGGQRQEQSNFSAMMGVLGLLA